MSEEPTQPQLPTEQEPVAHQLADEHLLGFDEQVATAAAHRVVGANDDPAREAYHQSEWEEMAGDKLALNDRLQKSETAHKLEKEARMDEQAAHTQTRRELRIRTDQAEKDKLTRLYNRYAFMERLDRETGHIRREGDEKRVHHLVMFDIDKFKQANDSAGHAFGDEVLKGFAATLTDELTQKGHLVCRYGGEEFAALLKDTTDDEAVELTELIGRLMRNTKFHTSSDGLDDQEYGPITVSAGVARLNQRGEVEAAFREADTALYASKARGRDRTTLFETGMRLNGDANGEQHRRTTDEA